VGKSSKHWTIATKKVPSIGQLCDNVFRHDLRLIADRKVFHGQEGFHFSVRAEDVSRSIEGGRAPGDIFG